MADQRVVLAYSGDLYTSAVLSWLQEHGVANVATLTLDVGQGRDLNDVRDRALGIGAARAHVIDVRDEFAREAVASAWALPFTEPRAAALARPLIAKYTVEIARIEGATAIAHASAFPATDPEGLEAALVTAGADLPIVAPAREWGMDVSALMEYGRERGIPVPSAKTRHIMEVRNLWGRSVTAEVLDDPSAEAPADLFTVTRGVEDWAKEAAVVEMTFKAGIPTHLNGIPMSLVELIVSLDTIAGAHGVGRFDHPAVPGVRPRTIEEAPASMLIHQALNSLGGKDGVVRVTCFMGEAK